MKPEKPSLWSRISALGPGIWASLGIVAVGVLGLIDYALPAQVSFISLQALLIGGIGWLAGLRPALLVSLAAVLSLNLLRAARGSGVMHWDQVLAWNNLFHLVAFGGLSWLTSSWRRAAASIRESDRNYRRLRDSMRDAVVSVDMAGRILEFNDAYREMVGYSPEELRRLTYVDLTPGRWHGMEARIVAEQILPRGYSEVYEKEYRRKDGSTFPVELRTFLLRSEAGQPLAMWAIVRDVTERHRAAEALQQARETLEQRVKERTAQIEATNVALRESEERYRSLVNNLNVGVFRSTPNDGILEANPALARVLGCGSIEELLRTHVTDFHPDPRSRAELLNAPVMLGPSFRVETPLKRKDGQIVHAAISGSVHHDAQGQIKHIDGVLEDVTERRQLERQILEISDGEQARLGQELHDGLCQQLVGLAFDANALVADLERTGKPGLDTARRLASGLDQAITETRQMSRGLFPVRIEGEGLAPALEELVRSAGARFNIECVFESADTVLVPKMGMAVQLFRIAQEALHNALRHSQANKVHVRLSQEAGLLGLEVEDDGRGIPRENRTGGMGLHIMTYRARSIGAQFTVLAGRERGTIIRCQVRTG